MIDARLITPTVQATATVRCAYGAKDAATMLRISESSVRRTAKRLGVIRIDGREVAGFVRFSSHPVDVTMPYTE